MHHRKIIRSFVKYIMSKYIMIILTSISLVWGQCEDGEVELWEECYSIAFTYELDLSEQELSGNVPTDLSLLSNLMFLDLSYNQLEGEIPNELGSLTNLLGLDLGNNMLSGSIPGELGSLTSLMTLNLSENQLSGPIPPELGSLTGLVDLYLFSNELSGELPAEIGDLIYLSEFIAYDNQLTGSLPEQFGNLESLIWMDAVGWSSLIDPKALITLPSELYRISFVLFFIGFFVFIFWRPLVLTSFDEEFGRSIGIPVSLLGLSLVSLTAIAAVASFDAVGSIIVISMIICPPAAARLLTNRIGTQTLVSLLIAFFSTIIGYVIAGYVPIWLGFSQTLSAAGTIATISGICLAISAIFGPHRKSTKKSI